MNLSLFRPRTRAKHATPHADPTPVPVTVKPTDGEPLVDGFASPAVTPAERQRPVIDNGAADGLEFNPDPNLSAEIRTHLWLRRNAQDGSR